MSELQTRFIDDTYAEYYNTGKHELAQIYLKSDADKVIAEKDAKIIQLVALIENYDRISREIIADTNHQKHKRCLAMAKVCYLRFVRYENYLQKLCASNATIAAYKFRRDLYDKWEKRWLELAEKFKLNNSTAQRAKETNKCLTTTNRTALSAEQ